VTITEADLQHCVYRYYDSADRLLYVGMTSNEDRREAEHAAAAPFRQYIADKQVERFSTRNQARGREGELIRRHTPPFNTVKNSRADKVRQAYLAMVEQEAYYADVVVGRPPRLHGIPGQYFPKLVEIEQREELARLRERIHEGSGDLTFRMCVRQVVDHPHAGHDWVRHFFYPNAPLSARDRSLAELREAFVKAVR
jgi:excinuclease UvrABC nuclease subunit